MKKLETVCKENIKEIESRFWQGFQAQRKARAAECIPCGQKYPFLSQGKVVDFGKSSGNTRFIFPSLLVRNPLKQAFRLHQVYWRGAIAGNTRTGNFSFDKIACSKGAD